MSYAGNRREWLEYRYGRPTGKKVTLPEIFTGESRTHAREGILDKLRDWRLSPFENEASCRTGIRQTLCLKGHGWQVSDVTAESIVSEGLHLLGAERPDWNEGQRHYSIPRENCVRCGCAIDEADQTRGYRFCSTVCARAYKQHLSEELPWDHELRRKAYWQYAISQKPARECKHCGGSFQSFDRDQLYCSKKCRVDAFAARGKANAGRPRSKTKQCKACSTAFKPSQAYQVYCCEACERASIPAVLCGCRGMAFRPTGARSVYCSPVCSSAARQRQKQQYAKANYRPSKVITLVIRRIEQIEEMFRAA